MNKVLKGLFLYEVEACRGPLVDLYETEGELICEVDVPGVDLSKLSIKICEDLLLIESAGLLEGDEEMFPGDFRYLCMERSLKAFKRIVKLPVLVNTLAATALYYDGVLTVRFPKLKGKVIRVTIERKGN
ncbi:MAG TPA: Hsp20/alpha crystallin family protein [Dissulfurispiraceae bacterium]|nr:Hsp20/alpha crystallin family protein [Dissulfurispiraceae bacterium]